MKIGVKTEIWKDNIKLAGMCQTILMLFVSVLAVVLMFGENKVVKILGWGVEVMMILMLIIIIKSYNKFRRGTEDDNKKAI